MKDLLIHIYRDTSFGVFLHKCYWYPYQKSRALGQFLQSIPRSLGFKDNEYIKLLALKDKYKGKRCFIACTGPSLTISDLEMLKDEYVFGMNSIALIHDNTDWKPDFYGIQDVFVFNKIKDKVLSTDNGIVFAPISYKKHLGTPENWVYWHMCGAYHLYEFRFKNKFFSKFSNNAYARVYDGYTITHSLLQIAVYMGFTEIYLLGADCSYLKDRHHFVETGVYDMNVSTAPLRFFTSYTITKQYTESHNIKVVNCTRGGALEIFEREELESVLNRKEKNKIYK